METALPQTNDPDELLSMNKAAKLLGVNRTLLTGILIGKGVNLTRVDRLLAVKRRDLMAIKALVKKKA